MPKLTKILILCLFFINNESWAQTWSWSEGMGGANVETGNDLIVDNDGNSYVTGSIFGNSNFDVVPVVSNGGTDIFIAKYDTDGNLLWVRTYGSILDDEGVDLAFDSSGNVVVLATFSNNFTFGAFNPTSVGGTDIAVLKLDTLGNPISVFTDGGSADDRALYIAVDLNDKVVISGHALEDMTFQGITFPSDPTTQFYVAKYTDQGVSVWLEQSQDGVSGLFGGFNNIRNVEVDGVGNIFVFANNFEPVSFAGLSVSISGLEECFIMKLDPSGNGLWARDINQGEDNRAKDMDVTRAGDIFITGTGDSDQIDFGADINGNPVIIDPFETGADGTYFLARYNTDGELFWAVLSVAGHVSVNENLQVICSGLNLQTSVNHLYFHDEDGTVIWTKELDMSISENFIPKMGIDSDGDIYAMDEFAGNLNFDGNLLLNSGSDDVFLAKINALSPCEIGPFNFKAETSYSKASISWNAVPGTAQYLYRYRADEGRWTRGRVTSNEVDIDGLAPATTYEFQVKSDCGILSPLNGFTFTTDDLTFSAPINEKSSLQLFPNPATDRINLQFNHPKGPGTIRIYDKNGMKVAELAAFKPDYSLDISNLPKGIYSISYEDSKTNLRYRFIKD